AAQGLVGRDELLRAESAAYHGPGTCTFYGTANSNQMLMEAMGLHVPGAAFVHPHDGLREALTREAVRTVLSITARAPSTATVAAGGIQAYTELPVLEEGRVQRRALPTQSSDDSVVRPASAPFSDTGGVKLLNGNLGRAVIKTSAVPADRHFVEAPARVFDS